MTEQTEEEAKKQRRSLSVAEENIQGLIDDAVEELEELKSSRMALNNRVAGAQSKIDALKAALKAVTDQ